MNYIEIFARIIRSPEYLKNIDWGEPRPGHPEGTIRAHVLQLERNLEKIRDRTSDEDYWRMLVVIHIHDLFKGTAKHRVPIKDPESHASQAVQFLDLFKCGEYLRDIVQFHDEPYAIYRSLDKSKSVSRLDDLLDKIGGYRMTFFTVFLLIDGVAPGKSTAGLEWWLVTLKDRGYEASAAIGREILKLFLS